MTPTFLTAAVRAPLMLGDRARINVLDHDSEAVARTLEVQR